MRIPGHVSEVRYYRGGGRHYRHRFKPGVRQEILADGSVRLYHPRRPVWADDREPGFERYTEGRMRNPGGTPTWVWVALGLGAVWLFTSPARPLAPPPPPVSPPTPPGTVNIILKAINDILGAITKAGSGPIFDTDPGALTSPILGDTDGRIQPPLWSRD
jgi:hypothetical protein